METLAPPHQCAIQLRMSIEVGDSLRSALRNYIKKSEGEFSKSLAAWFHQGADIEKVKYFPGLKKNPYRLALVRLIGSGLEGMSIYEPLLQLEEELRQQSVRELEEQLRLQPLKMMMPLLLFMFPAFLVLLFGPILEHLLSMLSQQ